MENFKLTQKPSILEGIECIEEVDIKILDKLINSSLLINDADWNEKAMLLSYKKLIKNGIAKVKYIKSKIGIGRVNPKIGLITLRREIKQTLTKDKYIDIDIINCHPIILSQLCSDLKIENLTKYINDRDKILLTMKDEYKMNRDDAKTLFIRIMYGGTYENYFDEKNIEIKDTLPIMKFIKDFQNEIKKITEMFANANPDLVKKIKKIKDNNIYGSLLSHIMQEYENQILEVIYNYCSYKKAIKNNECVLCYDGIMIKKDKYKVELLKELEEEILNKTSFKVNLIEKVMTEDYLKILDDNIIDEYSKIKNEFELNHFKLKNPIRYCEIVNDEIIMKTKRDFEDTYQNKIIQLEKPTAFTTLWMSDENIKTYDKIDFYPDTETPDNVYNSFKGFEASKKILKPCDFKTTLIYKHIENICGNDPKVIEYFEMFLSRKLKNPSMLTNTAFIFKSVQGTGKDTFFNYFGSNILGNEYYCNEIDTKKIFGQFNKLLLNKILVVIAESNSKKNIELTQDIKDAISRPITTIEPKCKESIKCKNYAGYVFLTNLENPINIPSDDRRFIAVSCNNTIANNKEYFDKLRLEMNSGDYDKAFFDYLINLDSINYNFNNKPETTLYKEMKLAYRDNIIDFLENQIMKNKMNTIKHKATDLFNDYLNFLKDGNFKNDISIKKFSMKFKSKRKQLATASDKRK